MKGYTIRNGKLVLATPDNPSKRKPHNWWAGYVAELRNSLTGDYTVLVDAGKAMLDTDGGRWATICNKHGAIMNYTSQKTARAFMKAGSHNWCEECMEIVATGRG